LANLYADRALNTRRTFGAEVIAASVAVCVLGLAGIGCESKVNPVASNQNFPGETYPANYLLNESDETAVVAAMQATAEGMPVSPLESATDAVRWSDVRQGVALATKSAEMGLIDSSLTNGQWVFRAETLGGAPALLTVEQLPPPLMYKAIAKVGVYGEEFDKAERWVREFRMAMRRLGKLKRPS
jgi:hypothetical protein